MPIILKKNRLERRVFFPQRSYYGKELQKEISDCHIGIALYDIGPGNGTYYADPAKIKTYTQYDLPVIMTDAAQVADYISKFKAGIIVPPEVGPIGIAITTMAKHYTLYVRGVRAFNQYFNYRTYYREKFHFLKKE